MFCEKCGTKNKPGAKFCENCGAEMTTETKKKKEKKSGKKENQLVSKMKGLSKKNKIIMGVVLLIVIVAIVVLCILLNNPIKKVEDYIDSYYSNYDGTNTELVEIGKILKNYKNDDNTLNKIKDTVHNAIDKWNKNFNTEYKSEDELDTAYDKVKNAMKDIYNYYDGLEYMLDYDLYQEYIEKLEDLYDSKYYYLKGYKNEKDNNEYYAYYYYQKVIQDDVYYAKAQEFINNYVKDEMTSYKSKVDAMITTNESATNEDILEDYLDQLDYLKRNKTVNNIDLSSTTDYQNLVNNAVNKINEYTKKVIADLETDTKYNDIVELIEEVLEYLDSDSDVYKELNTLKTTYEDKLPSRLINQYRVSYSGARYSEYTKTIDGKDYDFYVSFSFEGENQNIVYRLNNEYKTLKTTIVRGPDWDKTFTGYFVITGDGKELYKSDAITKSSELKADIEIDVTGVDDLKIEFVTTSKATGWDNFYIYLVEPYLYK